MSEENKEIVRRSFEMWNDGKLDVADTIFAADTTYHVSERHSFSLGSNGLRRIVSLVRAAFPDSRFTIDDIVAEGDRVAVRWTGRGHLVGAKREMVVTGIGINRVADGKIVESWVKHDRPQLVRELGIFNQEGQGEEPAA